MVVRLSDLQNEKSEKKKGVVRLSDIAPPTPKPAPQLAPIQQSEPISVQTTSEKPKRGALTTWFRETFNIPDEPANPLAGSARGLLGDNAFAAGIDRFSQAGAKMAGAPVRNESTTGSRVADTVLDVAGSIGGVFVNPLGPTSSVAGQASIVGQAYNNPAVQRLAQSTASRIQNPLGQRVAQEAIREGITGAVEAGTMAAIRGEDPRDIAAQTALGAALGGGLGAAIPAAGQGVQRLLSTFRPQQATPQGPLLALPAPRQPQPRTNTVETPDVIYATGIVEPIGLPEPNVAPPTTARVVRQGNPYRERLEAFAKEMEGAQLPAGRERETFLEAWGRFARPDEPDLETMIDLAYASRPNRVTPDLVQRARETQRMREVTGVGMPVRSMSDRYQGGVTASAASPTTTWARRTTGTQAQPKVVRLSDLPNNQQRKIVDVEASPVRQPPAQPRTPPQTPQQRGFVNTLSQSGRLSEDVQQGLQQSPNARYRPITNEGTVRAANRRIEKDMDAAEAYVLRGVKADPEQITTGMRLIQELQRGGQTERAVTIAEKLAEKLTKAGQTVQAASIWNRLTPEGALVAAQRKVATINREASKLQKPVEVTKQNADDIMTAAGAIQRAGASQERAAQVMDIADRLKKGESISPEEQELVSQFVKDLQTFVKPDRPPRPPRMPKEMNEPRIRDRVVSFMDEQEKAARERLKARGIQISSTPLDVWADYAIIGASKLAKGARSFVDWSEQMARDFGDDIRPHLAKIYDSAQDYLAQNTKTISQRAVSRAERITESYLKKNEGKLQPEDAEFIRTMARNVSELSGDMQKSASMELQAIMNGFERAGIGRKISSAQYISMLLNPVTQVRNILGNELMYRLERLNRIIATPVDIVTSALTGKPRQITFRKGPTVWENFFSPAQDYWKGALIGAKAGWRGINPEGLTTAYDISGQAFRSKLNPLTYLEKTLGAVMKGFDYAAYNRAVTQRIREMAYLDAINNGVKGKNNIRNHMDKYTANLDDNISAIAKEYGRYITLQDDTVLSKAATQGRRILNLYRNFGVGSIVLPFAKTPANLLMRAFEYSPAGFARSIYQASEILRKPNTDLTRADVIQSATRALLGTGLTGVGLWLADKGVLRGDSPGDKDVRNLERQSGLGQFQLNGSALQRMLGALVTGDSKTINEAAKLREGDVLWQYEWAQPTSVPLAVGANIAQKNKNEESSSTLGTVANAAWGGVNTLFNTSLLQGLQEAFEFPPGEDNKVKAFFANLAKSAPSMFTPSLLNRINQYIDSAQRETYTNDIEEYIKNSVKAKVPGLAQTLPQRVDTLGQPQDRVNTFFDVFVSPSQRSLYKPSKEAQLVMDLLSETGDDRVAPRTVPRYITGVDRATRAQKRIDLTPEQYTRYQRIVGEETARLLSRINPNMRTDKKVERVLDALSKAGEKGRKEMKKELGLRP